MVADDWLEVALDELDEAQADAVELILGDVFPDELVFDERPPGIGETGPTRIAVRVFLRRSDPRLPKLPALERQLTDAGVTTGGALRVGAMPVRNWGDAWREVHEPLPIGAHLSIQPPWCETTGGDERTIVRIDPGMAFGMGTHASTRLALQVIDGLFSRDERLVRDRRVLDVGAGSGILALTCLSLGARRAVCCDIDPNAGEAITHNARLNALDHAVWAFRGSTASIHDANGFDVVVANIVAPILLNLLDDFVRALAPHGHLVLSGIFLGREAEVLDATTRCELKPVLREESDGFVAIALARA